MAIHVMDMKEIGNDDGINIFTTTEQTIEYQKKIYQLRKEEIIGLYFYQFKRQIEKNIKQIYHETHV